MITHQGIRSLETGVITGITSQVTRDSYLTI